MRPKNLGTLRYFNESCFYKLSFFLVLGHVQLTHLLFDTMKKSAPARIINTTCAAYKLGEIDFDDINFERREYTHAKGYSQSKVAVAMFTKTFARKFPVEGITS